MQVAEVELPLAFRQMGQGGGYGFLSGAKQESPAAGDGYEGCALLGAEQFRVSKGVVFGQGVEGEELFGGGGEGDWVKAIEAVDDAMGGENHQAVGVHVNEGHHDGCFRIWRLGQLVGVVLGGGGRSGSVLF